MSLSLLIPVIYVLLYAFFIHFCLSGSFTRCLIQVDFANVWQTFCLFLACEEIVPLSSFLLVPCFCCSCKGDSFSFKLQTPVDKLCNAFFYWIWFFKCFLHFFCWTLNLALGTFLIPKLRAVKVYLKQVVLVIWHTGNFPSGPATWYIYVTRLPPVCRAWNLKKNKNKNNSLNGSN